MKRRQRRENEARRESCQPWTKKKKELKTFCTLREKHGDHYTTIQYRLWAEMVDIGTHRLEFDLRIYVLVAQFHVLFTGVSFGTQPLSTA